MRRHLDTSELPGDIQIDIAIDRAGLGSPCLRGVIDAKVARAVAKERSRMSGESVR